MLVDFEITFLRSPMYIMCTRTFIVSNVHSNMNIATFVITILAKTNFRLNFLLKKGILMGTAN